MTLTVMAVSSDALFSKLVRITLLTSSILVISMNGFVFDAHAQQGGAATGGDATVGGPSYNCNVAGACTLTQTPRGGDATGGDATGSYPPPESPPSESPPSESPPSESPPPAESPQDMWKRFGMIQEAGTENQNMSTQN